MSAARAAALALGLAALVAGCRGGCDASLATNRLAASRAISVPWSVPRASTPIVVDGRGDDAAWAAAPIAGPLADPGGHVVEPRTELAIAWQGDALVLLVRGRAATPASPGRAIDDQVHVELVAATARSAGLSLWIDPSGEWTVGRVEGDGGRDESARRAVSVATTRADGAFTIEASISLATLGARPERGARVGLSLSRCAGPRPGPRCGAWGVGSGEAARWLELDD